MGAGLFLYYAEMGVREGLYGVHVKNILVHGK
jgi:hypothetical protein